MENKSKIDPRVSGKLDEFKSRLDVRELSPEDLESVAGGQYIPCGSGYLTTHEEIDQFCSMLDEIEKEFSKDVAYYFALDLIQSPHITNAYKASSSDGVTFPGKVGVFLHFALDHDFKTLEERYSTGGI